MTHGTDHQESEIFSYNSAEPRAFSKHPLPAIRLGSNRLLLLKLDLKRNPDSIDWSVAAARMTAVRDASDLASKWRLGEDSGEIQLTYWTESPSAGRHARVSPFVGCPWRERRASHGKS